jgi:hypothetical protein
MEPERMTATFREALAFWTKLGFIRFGGPAGQIAIMHQLVFSPFSPERPSSRPWPETINCKLR